MVQELSEEGNKSLTKFCPCCKKNKQLRDFGIRKRNKNELFEYCKECSSLKSKEYYKNNRDKLLKKSNENREKYYKSIKQKYKFIDYLKFLLESCIYRAKKNNIPYDSIKNLCEHLKPIYSEMKCECCKKELVSNDKRHKHNSPSIDRIIPELGYVVGNVAILCWECNRLKNNATPEKLFQIATWYQKKINDNLNLA